jgi:hypothetical protein
VKHAALEEVMQLHEDIITPDGPNRKIPETNLEETIKQIARGDVQATISELLKQARLTRKMGMNHARVSQIKQASNLVKSVLETVQLLEHQHQEHLPFNFR